jgi:hypothetical protein
MRTPTLLLIFLTSICSAHLCLARPASRSGASPESLKGTVGDEAGAATFSADSRKIKPPRLAPIDQSTQAPLVSNVRSGFVVELWVGNTRVASSAPVPGGSTQTRVRLPHRLSPGQIVRAREKRGAIVGHFSDRVIVDNNYVTHRYDNERSGWNPNESELSVKHVRNEFGKICEHQVDAAIRAQPLYVEDVEIRGNGKHDVVLVATDGDQVWAFDADSCVPNDQGLWDAYGSPGPRKLLGPTENVPGLGHVPPKCGLSYGIWSTPVVDVTTNTMYVVASVDNGTEIFYRLHAIDIGTGEDRAKVEIHKNDAQFTHGGKTAYLDPSVQQNRPALLLDRGVVYLAFGSCGDVGSPYHGWVLAYDADLPGSATFLKQLGVFNTSPEMTGGCNTITSMPPCMAGVWQSGLGLAADGDGTVFLSTGNGDFDPGTGSYGNTVLRLRLPASSAGNQIQVVSFFTPYDWHDDYNKGDQDLGSGGPVLLTEGSRHFILAGGKPKKGYLIDRDCTHCSGDPSRCLPSGCSSDDPNLVIQTVLQSQGIVAGPAYYKGAFGTSIYYGYNFSPLTAFTFQPSPPLITNPQIAPDAAPTTSPIPTVSSRGSAAGSAVVWAVFHPPGGSQALTLHAYDADDITDNLFAALPQKSLDAGLWASAALGNSFLVPTVTHGKVYTGTTDRLLVFGRKRHPHCVPSIGCDDAVAFHCTRGPDHDSFELRRKKEGRWDSVTDRGSSKELPEFVDLWDYPTGDSATYAVCSKNQPDNCTQEFSLALPHQSCVGRGEKGVEPRCGTAGKPPCFLDQPWPVSRSEGTGKR